MFAASPFLFFYLLVAHALADTVFQGGALACAKRRIYNPDTWGVYLLVHGGIHGLFVYMVTGSAILLVAETLAHAMIDFGKCEKWYGTFADQVLHVLCKIVWVIMLTHALV